VHDALPADHYVNSAKNVWCGVHVIASTMDVYTSEDIWGCCNVKSFFGKGHCFQIGGAKLCSRIFHYDRQLRLPTQAKKQGEEIH
jgi:hypothetical protein